MSVGIGGILDNCLISFSELLNSLVVEHMFLDRFFWLRCFIRSDYCTTCIVCSILINFIILPRTVAWFWTMNAPPNRPLSYARGGRQTERIADVWRIAVRETNVSLYHWGLILRDKSPTDRSSMNKSLKDKTPKRLKLTQPNLTWVFGAFVSCGFCLWGSCPWGFCPRPLSRWSETGQMTNHPCQIPVAEMNKLLPPIIFSLQSAWIPSF